jgi:hypothetical protein
VEASGLARREVTCHHDCMHLRLAFLLAAALAAAPAAGAQRGTARLEGTVTDSMHRRPLAGATVLVTRNAPEPPAWYSVTADDRGRYRLDTLRAGRYSVALWHPVLDTLELTLPSHDVEIAEGQRATVDLGLPSAATLRATACAGVTLAPGSGVLQGQVNDADADGPLAGAVVAVRWSDLTVDPTTLRLSGSERTAAAHTNADGRYRICGLPTDDWLVVQVQHAGRGGSALRTTISDSVGLAVLNVAFSPEGSRTLAALDSAAAAAAAAPSADSGSAAPVVPSASRLLSGAASVSGTVLGETGQPMSGVQLRVLETAGTTRSDSAGRFTLGGLPAGTQVLEAKHVGYRIVQQPVGLFRGRSVETAVHLQRIVSLDSIRIVAQRSRYREFERQRRNGFGAFFTEEDIASRNASQATDLLRMTLGFRVVGDGLDAKVVSTRGAMSISGGGCEVNIVIDGMQHQDINWVQPSDIGAMEVYRGPAGAPVQYDSACGVIVVWTKR